MSSDRDNQVPVVQTESPTAPLAVQPAQLGAVDPAVAAAAEREKARLQMAFFIAQTRPRNEENSRARILAMCARRDFAVKALYKKPVGGGEVAVDLNVRFVEVALREWGNVLTEASVIHEDQRGRRVRLSAMDLQTNTQFTREVYIPRTIERSRVDEGREVISQRKNSRGRISYLLVATDDEMELLTNKAVSKALRNEGARLLPQDLKHDAREAIEATLDRDDGRDITTYRRAVLDAFRKIGIMPADVERLLGHSVGTATAKEMAELEVYYHQLNDGEVVWTDLVPDDGGASLAERIAAKRDTVAASTASAPAQSDAPSAAEGEPAKKRGRKKRADAEDKNAQEQEPAPTASTVQETVYCDYCMAHKAAESVTEVTLADGRKFMRCAECADKHAKSRAAKQSETKQEQKPAAIERCYFCNNEWDTAGDTLALPTGVNAKRCSVCKKKHKDALEEYSE